MGYKVPTFNNQANVWHNQLLGPNPIGPPVAMIVCQLRWCGKGPSESLITSGGWQQGWSVLCPKGTDLRDIFNDPLKTTYDTIECPPGTGRYYSVSIVDDVARGFANEYRIAYLLKTGVWPIPIP